MKWHSLAAVLVAGTLLTGCDKIPFLNKGGDDPPADSAAAEGDDIFAAAGDSTGAVQDSAAPAPAEPAPPPPRPAPISQFADPMYDEPWVPTHSGTVSPGMTLEQVVEVWGEPVATRAYGNFTYVYYRNGCERTCGMFDLVMLEGGQVIDAIVRTSAHVYSGTSSSPEGRLAQMTTPGRMTQPAAMPVPPPPVDTAGVIG
ncbi:MAG: outer membrane protein assembly factor BamE [Gemmatimonadota bacterium]|nr:outer membrane protein assembly factor BamE [Gemmatimonadota bacterium]